MLGDDRKGNLYGTAYQGGTYGYGVVFKVDKNNNFTVLHSFAGGDDGAYPYAGLTRATRLRRKQRHGSFTFYGTTYQGGSSNAGTVFKVRSFGEYALVHSFAGGTTDGCNPAAAFTSRGKVLVSTASGCGAYDLGMVYELTKKDKLTVLHNFAGGTRDGASPYASASSRKNSWGTLFVDGVTEGGGASGLGTVYELNNGTVTLLHSFAGGTTDGCYPVGTLEFGGGRRDSVTLGTAEGCGSSGDGIIWQRTDGKYTVAHNFAGGTADGAYPYAGVVKFGYGRTNRGIFVGTTAEGGTFGLGTVYEVHNGTVTLLHSFAGSDGAYPYAGVTVGWNGDLYGTTSAGGTYGYGTVWKLTP